MSKTEANSSPPSAVPNTLLRSRFDLAYICLAAIFIASLISCNLIFQKFFRIDVNVPFYGVYTFEQSVGLLVYPVTFLVTDILSEIYGAKRAQNVVTAGFWSSLYVMALIEICDALPSAAFGLGSETFHQVFGLSKIAIFASLVAYLIAQYIDIRIFHFWRRLTKGRHLWLRNNASTITSQLLDSIAVLVILASFGAAGITFDRLPTLLLNALLFKWLVALIDTPLFYLAVSLFNRSFPGLDLEGSGPTMTK